MEFLPELAGALLFEAPFEAAMESRRVKTWVKTLLFSLLGGAMAALFTVMTVSFRRDQQNTAGTAVPALITLGWSAFVVFGAIRGHKRKWKQK